MSQQAVSADIIPNSAVGIQKQKEQRHKQLGYTAYHTKFRSLKILGPLSNFKIQRLLSW